MSNERSYPVTIQLFDAEYQVMRKAGLALDEKSEVSFRLVGAHFDAIQVIIRRESRPGVSLSRAEAIRLALHKFCEALTQGQRYESLTPLVRDSLLWYAGELDKDQIPFVPDTPLES